MADVKAMLMKTEATARQKDIQAYLDAAVAKADISALKVFVERCADDSVPLLNVRPALQAFIAGVQVLDAGDNTINVVKGITNNALDSLTPRATSFTEEIVGLREILADLFSLENNWRDAAKALLAIQLDSCAKTSTEEYKATHFTRIAEWYLSADDPTTAETFVNRAWPLIKPNMANNLTLRFNACHARIHDAKRKFFDAAVKYYELSQMVPPKEQVEALRQSVVCVILGDAGSRRSRMLATLYKDERTHQLGPLYTVLEKVFHDRILRPKDVAEMKPFLQVHHEATTADGSTVLQRAVMQHNLFSASKLYYNITFAELGALLGVAPERAEKVAATMISGEQLRGTIDQLQSLIIFENDMGPMRQWDQQINAACNSVESISDGIISGHPRFAALLKTT
jgi:COP9 signalosome complex subunit 4